MTAYFNIFYDSDDKAYTVRTHNRAAQHLNRYKVPEKSVFAIMQKITEECEDVLKIDCVFYLDAVVKEKK